MSEYNGHKNYETWLVSVYLLDDPETILNGIQFTSLYELAHSIKDMVYEYVFFNMQEEELHGFANDLLHASLSIVDWRSLALGLIDGMDHDELAEYGYNGE